MENIELVIKIPEEIRLALINNIQLSLDQQSICDSYIKHAIINGTPLPKGHSDIIERDKIAYMRAIHDLKWGEITASECARRIKYSAPTIIEADKEQEDDKI